MSAVNQILITLLATLCLAVAGCGQKGPLKLPKKSSFNSDKPVFIQEGKNDD
jgi:predicted small lipoprotein YifL